MLVAEGETATERINIHR